MNSKKLLLNVSRCIFVVLGFQVKISPQSTRNSLNFTPKPICMSSELIFATDWPLHSQIILQFLHCSWAWSVLQVHAWLEHYLKLKPVKWAPSKHSPTEKKEKFRRAPEGVRTQEIPNVENGRRVFWVRILRIWCNDKSQRATFNVLYPPCPKLPEFISYFQRNSGRLRR